MQISQKSVYHNVGLGLGYCLYLYTYSQVFRNEDLFDQLLFLANTPSLTPGDHTSIYAWLHSVAESTLIYIVSGTVQPKVHVFLI